MLLRICSEPLALLRPATESGRRTKATGEGRKTGKGGNSHLAYLRCCYFWTIANIKTLFATDVRIIFRYTCLTVNITWSFRHLCNTTLALLRFTHNQCIVQHFERCFAYSRL